MLPHFRGQTEAAPISGNYFWYVSMLLGVGVLCCGCRLPSLVLGPPQLKGSFGSGSGPRSSVCDRWRHGLETSLQQTEIPVLSRAEGSPGCPHKQVPFHANSCPESSVPPTGEKPILFQCPTDGRSHQKAFHSFHHIMYCFVPFVVEEMVLPNIFHFLSQISHYKWLLSLLGFVYVICLTSSVMAKCVYKQ